MKKVVYQNSKCFVFDNGGWAAIGALVPVNHRREPANREAIVKADRARELGLPVARPAPIYLMPRGIAAAIASELAEVIRRVSPTRRWGTFQSPAIARQDCLHQPHCDCGNCPWETVLETPIRWVEHEGITCDLSVVPERWLVDLDGNPSRTQITVCEPDGSVLRNVRLGGTEFVQDWAPHEWDIERLDLPEDIAVWLRGLRKEIDARLKGQRDARNNAERDALAREFGLQT